MNEGDLTIEASALIGPTCNYATDKQHGFHLRSATEIETLVYDN